MNIQKGKISRSQRGVIYGCEGVGKSTFASKFPNPLFVDLEGGTAHLDVARVVISTWEELLNCIDELTKDRQGFESFVLDTADWAERLCSGYLCKKYKKTGIEDFGYGKGYQYLGEEFAQMLAKLTALQNAGMHILVLAHSMIKKLELPEENGTYDHYELKCSKQVSPLIKEWADGLLFANYRTFVQENANGKGKAIGGKERVLYTEHTAFCDAKNRWGLSGTLPLDFKSVADVFQGTCKAPAKVEVVDDESNTWGNVEVTDTRKADSTLVETALELGRITEEELNNYLRGKNPAKKVYIAQEQTYRDLSDEILERITTNESWEKIERNIEKPKLIAKINKSLSEANVSALEFNEYLRGKNSQAKAIIGRSESFENLSFENLEKLTTKESFEKVSSYIIARRVK